MLNFESIDDGEVLANIVQKMYEQFMLMQRLTKSHTLYYQDRFYSDIRYFTYIYGFGPYKNGTHVFELRLLNCHRPMLTVNAKLFVNFSKPKVAVWEACYFGPLYHTFRTELKHFLVEPDRSIEQTICEVADDTGILVSGKILTILRYVAAVYNGQHLV
jgi:hypothetical protein